MCPETIIVTHGEGQGEGQRASDVKGQGLTVVEWEEPQFSDNVQVISVKQNYRPGDIFFIL